MEYKIIHIKGQGNPVIFSINFRAGFKSENIYNPHSQKHFLFKWDLKTNPKGSIVTSYYHI